MGEGDDGNTFNDDDDDDDEEEEEDAIEREEDCLRMPRGGGVVFSRFRPILILIRVRLADMAPASSSLPVSELPPPRPPPTMKPKSTILLTTAFLMLLYRAADHADRAATAGTGGGATKVS